MTDRNLVDLTERPGTCEIIMAAVLPGLAGAASVESRRPCGEPAIAVVLLICEQGHLGHRQVCGPHLAAFPPLCLNCVLEGREIPLRSHQIWPHGSLPGL